ncbi:hypothetical protein F4604DRAFT_1682489 [Suillus subluteus]|nr:hypothetical protein F4604DRAFT_1682489 [Suillus subluteus]
MPLSSRPDALISRLSSLFRSQPHTTEEIELTQRQSSPRVVEVAAVRDRQTLVVARGAQFEKAKRAYEQQTQAQASHTQPADASTSAIHPAPDTTTAVHHEFCFLLARLVQCVEHDDAKVKNLLNAISVTVATIHCLKTYPYGTNSRVDTLVSCKECEVSILLFRFGVFLRSICVRSNFKLQVYTFWTGRFAIGLWFITHSRVRSLSVSSPSRSTIVFAGLHCFNADAALFAPRQHESIYWYRVRRARFVEEEGNTFLQECIRTRPAFTDGSASNSSIWVGNI